MLCWDSDPVCKWKIPNPHRGPPLLFCGSHPVPSNWLISPDTPGVVLGERGLGRISPHILSSFATVPLPSFASRCISSDHSIVCLLKHIQRIWIKLQSTPVFPQNALLGSLLQRQPGLCPRLRSPFRVSSSSSSSFNESSAAPTFLVTGQALVYPEELCQESAHRSPSFLLPAAVRLLSNYLWTWQPFHILEKSIQALVYSFPCTKDRTLGYQGCYNASCQVPLATQSKSFSETKEKINLQYLTPKSYIKVNECNPWLFPQLSLSREVVSKHSLKHQPEPS